MKRYCARRLYPIWNLPITLDQAMTVYAGVSEMLEQTGDRVDPGWDETAAALARVVLNERAQARAVAEAYPQR